MLTELPGLIAPLRRVLFAATICAFTLWVHLHLFSTGFEWDSHLFLLIGRLFGHGLLPYRDLWEVKPPGIFFYVRAVFSVLPEAVWSIRIADFFLYLAAAATFYALCRVEAGPYVALGGTALWLYYSHHFEFNAGGLYTEEYSAIFSVGAVAGALAYRRRQNLWYAAAAGLSLAVAVSFKHPALASAGPALVLIADRHRPAAVWFLVFAAAPILLIIAYFAARGGIDSFIDCNLWYPLEYAAHGGRANWLWPRLQEAAQRVSGVLHRHPPLGAALFLGLLLPIVRPGRTQLAFLLWIVLDFLAVATQGKYHRHHFIQTFPALCVAGAAGAGWVLRAREREHPATTGLRFALTVGLLWLVHPSLEAVWKDRQPRVVEQWRRLWSGPENWLSKPWGDSEEEIAVYIRGRTGHQDRLHLRGYGPSVVSLYWAVDRLPASRFFYSHPTIPLGPVREQQQVADLEKSRPPYVVLVGELGQGTAANWIAAHYETETVIWRQYRAEILSTRASVDSHPPQ